MTGVTSHTVCWLLCHGQTEWNREHRFLSYTHLPLTPFGRRRAAATAWRLRRQPLTAIVSSDLEFAVETAAVVAVPRAGQTPAVAAQDWREGSYGRWEGLTYRELIECYPDEARARWADPWKTAPGGGETLDQLCGRIDAAWRRLLAEHDGGRLALVTHVTPIQLILAGLLRLPPDSHWQLRIDLGSISCVDLYPSVGIVRTVNEVPLLRGIGHG